MPAVSYDTNECPNYPGTYHPSPEVEKFVQNFHSEDAVVCTPLLNLDEFDNCYKMDIVIPGARREDIMVYTQENMLSVIAVHSEPPQGVKKTKIHEFDSMCFERHILLPADAGTEFINAEFREGLLHLFVPKSYGPQGYAKRQIAVY